MVHETICRDDATRFQDQHGEVRPLSQPPDSDRTGSSFDLERAQYPEIKRHN